MLIKSKAIVVKNIRYGDNKLIIELYTAEHGRVTVSTHISTSQKGRMKRLLFQPLTMLNVEYEQRNNQQIQRLKTAAVAQPWMNITSDPVKITIALFIAEILGYTLRQEQAENTTFAYIEHALQILDLLQDKVAIANFHIAFLIHLTEHLGFSPTVGNTAEKSIFDMRSGEFVSHAPLHEDFLTDSESEAMRMMMRMTFRNMHIFRYRRSERQRCLDLIIRYFRIHLPSFPELCSLAVMQEIYGD